MIQSGRDMQAIWQTQYPEGIPKEIPVSSASIQDVFLQSCSAFSTKIAYSNMGVDLTFAELERQTRDFAAYLQNKLEVKKGDRLAIMLPNILQYPVAMFGAFRAGLIVVNVNPLYKAREIVHQFNDTGVTTVVVLNNFAATLMEAVPHTGVKHIIVTELGDLFPFLKSKVVNFVIKHVKKMVPEWSIPHALKFVEVLKEGRDLPLKTVPLLAEDIAYLQSTGGTTGIAKSAVLSHRNMLANVDQMAAWATGVLGEEEIMLTPLPLYHIFSLCVNCIFMMKRGHQNVLITNPRDISGFIKEMIKIRFTAMSGVNTLFNALLNHSDFKRVDFSTFRLSIAGGMALQSSVAERWRQTTGHCIVEGYGLTETSPVVSVNPFNIEKFNGSIGLPLPSTWVDIRDDSDRSLALGEIGELCVKGPQVMTSYWQKPEETAKVFTKDGFLRTGDLAFMETNGYLHLVDRKKNMIIVSGFNVYPNEVEDVLTSLPGILEAAVIGVPDIHSNEAVKAFIVRKDSQLTEAFIRDFCKQQLTPYKVPKYIEFRTELPKTNIGKILHRELRTQESQVN